MLAGGAGSRLGGAKATALLAGAPLIEHVLEAVRAGGLEAVVIAKASSPLPPLDVRVVLEPDLPRHPVCGIVTGLRELVGGDDVLVVCACDMPFVTGELLAWIAQRQAPLAVASASRMPDSPNLPTVAETLLGFESVGWQALLAPAGTPDAIVRKVNTDLLKAMHDPDNQRPDVLIDAKTAQDSIDVFDRRMQVSAASRVWMRVPQDVT